MSESEDEEYGPAMPPGFPEDVSSKHESPVPKSTGKSSMLHLSHKRKSHQTKKHTKKRRKSSSSSSDSSSDSQESDSSEESHRTGNDFTSTSDFIGPIIPGMSNAEEDDNIGPSLSLMASGNEDNSAHDIEVRAQQMKDRLMGHTSEKDIPTVREDWMTALPAVGKKDYGMVNRVFQKNPKSEMGDQSVWTDTPADRLRKEQETDSLPPDKMKKKAEEKVLSARDKYLSEQVDEYNKNMRGESLLKMHQKKKKKKEKKEKKEKKKKKKKNSEKEENVRVPFDRDSDLKIDKRLSHTQKGAIINNAQKLNTKFSFGSNKFL